MSQTPYPPFTPDGGPRYVETHWEWFIKEPFNATTAFLFAAIAIYWLYRLRGQWRKNDFLVGCLVVLLVGGIGGTLFHGLRVSRYFLIMDVLPIFLIAVALAVRLWRFLLPAIWAPPAVLVSFVGIQWGLHQMVPRSTAINAGYAMTALMIILPLLLVLRKRPEGAKQVFLAIGLFAVGLFFRAVDGFSEPYISIGTHWLWHLFSAASVWFLISFLARFRP
ncbi:hypothetical protein K2X33_02195 [bacterium]|nr:hypothetical protein [bacterium]